MAARAQKNTASGTISSPFRILIADDDRMLTEMLYLKISGKGCKVDVVNGGWDALHQLEKESYDLLITDLMMPDISGLTLISLLKNYAFSKLPVIIVSNLERPDIILTLGSLGVVDYYVKPLKMDQIMSRITKLKDERMNKQH